MNKFEKVSFNRFVDDMDGTFYHTNFDYILYLSSTRIYDEIKLPQRATKASAGYDFYSPYSFDLEPGQTIKIPTGVRCQLDSDKFLAIVPRSSLGFKYRLQLDNTMGVVDSDYYNADNEGHIFIKVTNDSRENKLLQINQGDAFAQGIILPYYLTDDDNVSETRVGGMGSTDKK